MFKQSVKILAGASLLVAGMAMVAEPAVAKSHRVKRVRLVPAKLKPTYVGAPGFVGGPPGPAVPALFDYPAPTGVFTGIPVLAGLGL